MTSLRVDAERLLGRVRVLGEVDRYGDGRLTRLARSDTERVGRDTVAGWMRDAGFR